MCSGCAGDYSGGFDSDENDEFAADGGEERVGGRWLNTGGAGGGSDDGMGTDAGGRIEQDPSRGAEPDRIADDYEVLVSGTQIVELRIISVSFPQGSGPESRQGLGRATTGKQSRASTAKYYPTQPAQRDDRRNLAQIADLPREPAAAAGFWHACKENCGKRMQSLWRRLQVHG